MCMQVSRCAVDEQFCRSNLETLAQILSSWYFWVVLLVLVMLSAVFVIVCVLCCCCRNRKSVVLARLWQTPPPISVLRTCRDPQGIIQPDVMFFKRPPTGEVQVVAPTLPVTKSSLRLATAIRPLPPAYEPTQPVTITTARTMASTSNELTLPPGYISNRAPKYQ